MNSSNTMLYTRFVIGDETLFIQFLPFSELFRVLGARSKYRSDRLDILVGIGP